MLIVLFSLLVLTADRVMKIWAMANKPNGSVLIRGVLQLLYTENKGMAFGLFSGQTWVFAAISALALGAAFLMAHKFKMNGFCRAALGLAIGGAAGNLIDRIFLGYVVDMFDFLFVRFAVFNVADAGLTIGTGMLMVAILFMPKAWEVKKQCK